jgi:outer membrane receptor protein involved in Fe transport
MEDAIEVFFVAENVFNKWPPLVAGSFSVGFYQGLANANYDQVGRTFRMGTRFKF